MNKQKMVRDVGRRTRLKNHDVQAVVESLIDVWTQELVSGGRIELEGFCVLEVRGKGTLGEKTTLRVSRILLNELRYNNSFK